MLNFFNDAYPSFGLNPFLSHFSLLVNYLVVVFFILILRIKNYLNRKEMIILTITSSSPFFFNNFLFPWDFMYDQVRYYNYTGYLISFGTLEEIDIYFENQLKKSIFFSSLIFYNTFINHISAIALQIIILYFLICFLKTQKLSKIQFISYFYQVYCLFICVFKRYYCCYNRSFGNHIFFR